MRATRPYTYLGTVQGMCRQCRQIVPARVVESDGAVYQESLCPTCPPLRALIAEDAAWYHKAAATPVRCWPWRSEVDRPAKGCPHDCGPCAGHATACHLPVFSITNACQLACPICFTYNRPDRAWHMPREELAALLDKLIARTGPLDLINITGGEPTLHPGLLDLLDECGKRPEIGRITMNSNGLRLATDEILCRELASRGVYVILSFDTFDPATSQRIHGRDLVATKLAALANLQKHGIGTTLLNVMIGGVNDHEIGRIIALAKSHDNVRSVTVQTMTFTGAGGGSFGPRQRVPLDAAARIIESATDGELRRSHFIPHPLCHPLCYSVAYYLRGPRLRSMSDLLPADRLRDLLGAGYLMRPNDAAEASLKEALDNLWARGEDEDLLQRVRQLLLHLYPSDRESSAFERQRLAEERMLAVYLHAHMDEDTLDLGRLSACPDQVPTPDGRLIPACAYNLFYRRQDPRFFVEAAS